MTPQEKAHQLVDRFFNKALPDAIENNFHTGVLCALIAVEEILIIQGAYAGNRDEYKTYLDYWQEVKQEIQKL